MTDLATLLSKVLEPEQPLDDGPPVEMHLECFETAQVTSVNLTFKLGRRDFSSVAHAKVRPGDKPDMMVGLSLAIGRAFASTGNKMVKAGFKRMAHLENVDAQRKAARRLRQWAGKAGMSVEAYARMRKASVSDPKNEFDLSRLAQVGSDDQIAGRMVREHVVPLTEPTRQR